MSTPGPVARLASLFYEDAALTEGVQWLIDKHLRALEGARWADELKMAAMQLLADGLLPDDYDIADINADGLLVISRGRRFPLREMSDGYRSVAALVVDLIKQFQRPGLWPCGSILLCLSPSASLLGAGRAAAGPPRGVCSDAGCGMCLGPRLVR